MQRMRSRTWSSKRVDCSGGVRGFIEVFITVYSYSLFSYNSGCKRLSGDFNDQVIEHRRFYRAGFDLDNTLARGFA